MKLEDAVKQLVAEFGSADERRKRDKIVAVIIKVMGDREVPDRVFNKVVAVGLGLKKLGIG